VGLSDLMDAAEGSTALQTAGGRKRRRGRWVLAILLAVAVLAAAAVLELRKGTLLPVTVQCEADTAKGVVLLAPDQMANAATITAVADSRALPQRAVAIALATAMQESRLENLTAGDRDSVGLFQQRPSQGWGSADKIADPVYATGRFLDALVKVPDYTDIPLTEAAQAVQHSGYPDAYAQHESDATILAQALTGTSPGAVSCQLNDVGTAAAGPVGSDGLQPGGRAVATALTHEFGAGAVAVSAAPAAGTSQGSGSGSGSGSDAAARKGLVLEARPKASGADAGSSAGWALAQWAVAHAASLHLSEVGYDGKVWKGTRADSPKGWVADPAAPAGAAVRITVAAGAQSTQAS